MCVDVASPSPPHTPLRTPRRARTHPYAHARPNGSPHRRALSMTLGINLNFAREPRERELAPAYASATCLDAPAKYISASSAPEPWPSPSASSSNPFCSSSSSTPTSTIRTPYSASMSAPIPPPYPDVSTSLPSTVPPALSPASTADPPLPSGAPRARHQIDDARLAPYLAPGPSFSPLTPNLVLGDLAFAEDAAALEREGVTHVVSVVGGRVHVPSHIPLARRLHVPLPDAPFADLVGALAPVVAWVRAALAAGGVPVPPGPAPEATQGVPVPEKGGGMPAQQPTPTPVRVLVHCAHGISRSPAVGAALLVALPLVDGVGGDADAMEDSDPATPPTRTRCTTLSAAAAIAYVAARRPATDVNWGFRTQLAEWENVCRAHPT
ncbi:protein-tyrosine phosphatase-like protein [Mycena pura]|uniref:Protein-tyrosine phosphatase-like protein n=1 Tax=Mycena pura TaxID=153505 RepID=A0AAD6UTQ8_9AGAR|nr:protein-tyrosine phosphatase-like protein [Mycena pura]